MQQGRQRHLSLYLVEYSVGEYKLQRVARHERPRPQPASLATRHFEHFDDIISPGSPARTHVAIVVAYLYIISPREFNLVSLVRRVLQLGKPNKTDQTTQQSGER